MRTGLLWALLVVLCQFTLVSSHVLGRSSYSTADLDQLKSILQRIEETLAETGQQQEENVEAALPDYEVTNPEPERGQVEVGQRPSLSDKLQSSVEGHSRTPSQISRLQDLLMAARSRSSSCFGARMDRIGNASGLGCNTGRG